MANELNLSEIQGLGSSGAYDGTFTLSGDSAALCLSWLAILRHFNWEGAGYELTDAEKDDIDEMIATALLELMLEATVDGTPLGAIIWTCTTDNLEDYIHCVGGNYDRVDYPDLYALLDDVYIIDVDTFTVPDLHGRVVIGDGRGGGLSDRDAGDTGGVEEHTLTTDEMPAHTHTIEVFSASASDENFVDSSRDVSSEGNATTSSEGSDDPHENMPPFEVIRPWIRAKVS